MRSIVKFAALLAATISLCSVAQAEPLISAFIGTPTATSKLAYFVLDFNDPGPNPETYAFGWHYEGAKTGQDYVQALAASLTGANGFVATPNPFFPTFYNALGYNGRVNSSDVNPFGYWNLWLGFDGTNWTSSEFGAASITLSDTPTFDAQSKLVTTSWVGWRWVNDYRTETAITPRTPQQVAAVVPEAGTVALFGTGLGVGLVLVRRRRERR